MKEIRASSIKTRESTIITARVVEDGQVLAEKTVTWSAEVPLADAARETRLLLREELARRQAAAVAPSPVPGLDGERL